MKFGFGSSGRAERVAESFGGTIGVTSILLNPTAKDSLAETTFLRLALGLGEDLYEARPLSNYVWWSERPLAKQITHMRNPDDSEPIWARIKLGYE